MDDVERKVSLFGVGIALVIAIIWAVEWVKKTPVKTTQKFVKGKTCPAAYPKHVDQFCEHILKASDSYWATRFLFVFVVALFLLFFTLRRKGRRRVLQFFPGPRPGRCRRGVRLLGCLARRARLSTAALRRGVVVGIEQGRERDRASQAGGPRRDTEVFVRTGSLARSRRTTPRVQALHPKAETAQALNRAKTRS